MKCEIGPGMYWANKKSCCYKTNFKSWKHSKPQKCYTRIASFKKLIQSWGTFWKHIWDTAVANKTKRFYESLQVSAYIF